MLLRMLNIEQNDCLFKGVSSLFMDVLTTCHPWTGGIIFHFCLRTSGSEGSSRLGGLDPQWAVMLGSIIIIIFIIIIIIIIIIIKN